MAQQVSGVASAVETIGRNHDLVASRPRLFSSDSELPEGFIKFGPRERPMHGYLQIRITAEDGATCHCKLILSGYGARVRAFFEGDPASETEFDLQANASEFEIHTSILQGGVSYYDLRIVPVSEAGEWFFWRCEYIRTPA